MTKEDLQAIRAIIQEELEPVKSQLAELAEAHEETRAGVNTLLEWAEDVGTSITFPLPKIAKIAK